MSQMIPEAGEGMRRAACGDASALKSSENKELLRRQLLSSKERKVDKCESSKVKHPRSRQKNRWKLKFHHQALPQEYLDHYEQSLQKANSKKKSLEKPKEQNVENFPSETFKIWAQRLAGLQNETGDPTIPAPALNMPAKTRDEKKKRNPAIAPSKIMTYEDLPYMGEMTLNNSKPRRGRKPKKADICHLIYENYGTVVPGRPPPPDRPNTCPPFKTEATQSTPRTDLQNRIISSLLEKKLCQENKRRLESPFSVRLPSPAIPSPSTPPAAPPGPPPAPRRACVAPHGDREPLNLCIRDLRDLKLQIQRRLGDIHPEVKMESDDEESPKCETPNAISVIRRTASVSSGAPSPSSRADDFPGYVYWPDAGVYMHPLALQTQLLYCRRLAAAHSPGGTPEAHEAKSGLVLKQISELLEPEEVLGGTASPDRGLKRSSPRTPAAPAPTAAPHALPGPAALHALPGAPTPPAPARAKRKRSAIFIPPIPAKSNSMTPTTEVSICKFKFTGGSKPSLQEKKMLSVDSGGNFRYYSGNGTKGNRGYEFLHKDSNGARPEPVGASASTVTKGECDRAPKEDSKKKRKSRKTLQREKLEQTFKEKGFLIQTQQLQSAEGATYCKFRQLRKFTRYLFRSWRDYLPGELAGGGGPEGGEEPPVAQSPGEAGEPGDWT